MQNRTYNTLLDPTNLNDLYLVYTEIHIDRMPQWVFEYGLQYLMEHILIEIIGKLLSRNIAQRGRLVIQ